MTASATGVPPGEAGFPGPRPVKTRTRPAAALLEPAILRHALLRAFVKLDPRLMVKIPVMFVVEIGSVITTIELFARPDLFVGLVTLWLWATVLFANFAEAVADSTEVVPSAQLKIGDRCVVAAGEVIPGDGGCGELPVRGRPSGSGSTLMCLMPSGATMSSRASQDRSVHCCDGPRARTRAS